MKHTAQFIVKAQSNSFARMLGEPILEMYMMIVAPLLGCDESQY
jgi:hypothetical protein